MSYARYKGKLLNPLHEQDLLQYDEDSDILWLVNGGPVAISKTLFPDCEVYFDHEGKLVTGRMIRNAKTLLSPVFSSEGDPESVYIENIPLPSGTEKEIIYVKESDTMSLSNGTSGGAGIDLFMGCIVFTDMSNAVSSMMLDDAGHLILPLFDK